MCLPARIKIERDFYLVGSVAGLVSVLGHHNDTEVSEGSAFEASLMSVIHVAIVPIEL